MKNVFALLIHRISNLNRHRAFSFISVQMLIYFAGWESEIWRSQDWHTLFSSKQTKIHFWLTQKSKILFLVYDLKRPSFVIKTAILQEMAPKVFVHDANNLNLFSNLYHWDYIAPVFHHLLFLNSRLTVLFTEKDH